MHHPTDRIEHPTAFVTPVVEHWLEREIAQWVHPMKDRSDDPSHHERTFLRRSYIWLRPAGVSASRAVNPLHGCCSWLSTDGDEMRRNITECQAALTARRSPACVKHVLPLNNIRTVGYKQDKKRQFPVIVGFYY